MKTATIFILVLYTIVISALSIYGYNLHERLAMNELGKISFNRDTLTERTNGVYNMQQKFYCVSLKHVTYENTIKTDYHEVCHHLVYENKNHFCTDDDVYTSIEGSEKNATQKGME